MPAEECPKCGLRPLRGDACARCGLAIARMGAWADDHVVPPELEAAWAACLAAWEDPATHDRAADLARSLIEQPWLARRYRAVLSERPGDPIALARRERLAKIAAALLVAAPSAPPAVLFRRGSSSIVLAALVLLVAGGLVYALRVVQQEKAARPPPTRAVPLHPSLRGAPWQQPALRARPPTAPSLPATPPSLPDRRVESRPPGE